MALPGPQKGKQRETERGREEGERERGKGCFVCRSASAMTTARLVAQTTWRPLALTFSLVVIAHTQRKPRKGSTVNAVTVADANAYGNRLKACSLG